MEKKIVVGIDADGVLTDMSGFLINDGRKYFKKEPVDPNAYHIRDIFGVSKRKETIYGLRGGLQRYCTQLEPREGCKEVIYKLNEEGYALHEITARKFTTKTGIIGTYYRKLFERWLKKHDLKFESIEYCSEEYSPRDKLLGCKKLNVDVMIEDKPDVALYLAQNGVNVLLVDAPYNKDLNHENIKRVYNWEEIYKEISFLKKNKKVEDREFEFKTKQEKASMSDEEKIRYFNDYHHYLKNLNVNMDRIRKGQRRFKLIHKAFYLPIKAIFKPKVTGAENTPYQDGFIVASNHLNSYDQYLISYALGNKHFSGFAASSIENTFRGKLFKFIEGSVFINRRSAISKKNGEEELSSRLVNGNMVLIFPEGTRKNKDKEGQGKEQLPFKFGTVSMAQKTGAPILPVSVYYGEKNTYVQISELFYVSPTDDLTEKNEELENIILSMTRESMKQENELKEKNLKTR